MATEESRTPEAALAAFDRAEQSVNQLLGPTQSFVISQQAGAAAAPQAPEPPPPPAAPPPAAAQPKGKESAKAAEAGPRDKSAVAPALAGSDERVRHSAQPPATETCTTACSALASMARAADHLCGLAGATDSRCTGARERLKNASTRVHASCPGCSS
jgi:hypothetical protein